MKSKTLENKGKVYNTITNEQRIKLLQLVKSNKVSLVTAAKMMKINYSTVKTIMRIFRKENTIIRKSKKKEVFRTCRSDLKLESISSESIRNTQNQEIIPELILSLKDMQIMFTLLVNERMRLSREINSNCLLINFMMQGSSFTN